MSGYRWRDPGRRKPPASEKEMPPRPPSDPPETACVFCGMTGVPLKRDAKGRDPVCEDGDACLTRGWAGSDGD